MSPLSTRFKRARLAALLPGHDSREPVHFASVCGVLSASGHSE
ncbi:MAG: hypothetical protein ACTSXH_02395 [Promethearchaeota archaeon]